MTIYKIINFNLQLKNKLFHCVIYEMHFQDMFHYEIIDTKFFNDSHIRHNQN